MNRDSAAPDIAAVVFDVGRVLFRWDLRYLFSKLIADEAELEWFLANVVTEEWHFQQDAGRPLEAMVSERVVLYPDHAPLIEAYAARYNETIPGPVPGSIELVEALHGRGVPLFAITNFGHELWQPFRASQPVFDRFIDIVVSGTERIMKPDPAIYDLAARRFGHPPERMLFIDDTPANVASALQLGWQVHHFRDSAALESDLRARGLV